MRKLRLTRQSKIRLVAAVAAALALGIAATALANVTIYSNSFARHSDYKQIRPSGKHKSCDRSYREKAERMRIDVQRGRRLCEFKPPVIGDTNLPDQDVRIQGKFLKRQTPKSQRKGAYIGLGVRVGAGVRYELTVKPKNKRYFVTREPDGPGFPVKGSLKQIKSPDKMNTLRLRAFGTRIRAFVNGKKVASKKEKSPGDVNGRRIIFGLGNSRPAKKSISGLVDNLRVQVPNPNK